MVINNFVVSTAEFFNAFSETVEKKISNVSNKITELEILLSVLEAKLNSVPGLEFSSDDLPQAESSNSPEIPISSSEQQGYPEASSVPVPANIPVVPVAEDEVLQPAVDSAVDSSKVKASDHPDYAQFFRLLKVGVPVFVVQAKVSAAGLDPSVIETPDALMDV